MVDQVINQMNSKSNDSDDEESDDEIEVENPDTKVKSTVTLEGLANFFA